jgi:hypothetical protein
MKIIRLTLNEKENIYVFSNKIISLYRNENIEKQITAIECVDGIHYMVSETPLQIIELINS